LDKEGEKMQKKFEDKLATERKEAVAREADLLEKLNQLRKDYSEAVLEVKRHHAPPLPALPGIPNSFPPPPEPLGSGKTDWKEIEKQRQIDPEKEKMRYIQQHNNMARQMP
jgi:hypothetical protein